MDWLFSEGEDRGGHAAGAVLGIGSLLGLAVESHIAAALLIGDRRTLVEAADVEGRHLVGDETGAAVEKT